MPSPDDVLIDMLHNARGFRRVEIAAALGDSDGEAGPGALRTLLRETGTGTTDLRCAALLALGKRCGVEASDEFGVALSGSTAVRDYAVLCLAAFGDDSHWEAVLQMLQRRLKRRTSGPTQPSIFVAMVTYLARHVASAAERSVRLAGLLRHRGDALDSDDQQWLLRFWPSVLAAESEADVEAPDAERMHRDLRANPLFERAEAVNLRM